MVDRINPIIPRNPDVFPVPPVALPKIDPQERDQRRREREEELREQLEERGRRQRRPRPEGGGTLDVTA